MRSVVIYKSRTGYTKKYAEWIAQELAADIFDVSQVTIDTLKEYDTVIYGGSLHAVGVDGVKIITGNLDKLKDKKIAVFATGASPYREEVVEEVREKNFTPEQQKYIKFFYMRGGFNFSKLPVFDKFLMSLLKLKIKYRKKKGMQLSSDEIGMLAIYDKPTDYTRKQNIDALLEYVKE